MRKTCTKKVIVAAVLASFLVVLLPKPSRAGTLSTDVIGLFPKDVGEFAYADLKSARKFAWFPTLKEQMLPQRFRQFEQFLAQAGVDLNNQVEELAWAAAPATANRGEQVVGVALGSFTPDSTVQYFKQQKLPTRQMRGFTLFAFGNGTGPSDIFFVFLDSNTAAFGQRDVLESLIAVRFGDQQGLLSNNKFVSLIGPVNGQGLVWAVLNQQYAQLGLGQLLPEAAQFPQAGALIQKIQAMTISIAASTDIQANFESVCSSPEDANTLAALLQAGILYRRYQANEHNPDLAQMLDKAQVTPRGDRLDVNFSLTQDQLLTLIRHNTFAVKM